MVRRSAIFGPHDVVFLFFLPKRCDFCFDLRVLSVVVRSQANMSDSVKGSSDLEVSPAERYERGIALKKAGLHKSAIDQFEMAAADLSFSVKAYAQMGLCYKLSGRCEDAITAFQKALKATPASSKETVQILYVLGRTLESLGRVAETLEAYRWIRREDAAYRDVAERIERLSSRRPALATKKS
jgi:tetratricopeptide (TPR) repeat protein